LPYDNYSIIFALSSKTEVGSAGKQPARVKMDMKAVNPSQTNNIVKDYITGKIHLI
jgi:hypothetical protein